MNEYPQPQSTANPATDAAAPAALPATTPKLQLPPPALDDPQVKRANRNAIIAAVVVSVLLGLLTIVLIYLLTLDPLRTANIRDIVIILAAIVLMFMSVVIGVLLVVLIYRLQELTHFMRAELVPLILQVSQAVRSVSGTTRLVSDNIARPTIKVASFVAGVQQVAKSVNTRVSGQSGNAQRQSPGTGSNANNRTSSSS